MQFHELNFYHLYNRTNNNELLFKEIENYRYFLKNFRTRFKDSFSVHAYCLMPTHFYFIVQVKTEKTKSLPRQVGIHLSSYTKAINKRYDRHGSLFQSHTKSKIIDNPEYLIRLITYIHQNPIRAKLVEKLEDWPFSSYPDLAGFRNDSFINKTIIETHFSTKERFIRFSEETITRL